TIEVSISTSPGKVEIHHALSRYSRPSWIIPPHDGVGGWMPRPRKESVASSTIARASSSVATTTSDESTLGRMWRAITRRPERRAERAAHHHRRDADRQRDARPVDHAREDVAPEVVGAEEPRAPVRRLERGRGQPSPERLTRRIVGREPRRGHRDRAQCQDE